MRGSDTVTGSLFSYVDIEQRVPPKHPLRLVRGIVNDVLGDLDATFEGMYSEIGRPSIPPEKLLRASLIQAFYTVRSERQLMEQLNYNLLFRWFVGLGIDDPVWDHSTFSKNRDRLLEADIAKKLLTEIIAHPKVRVLLSDEHFTVDGTMVQAWASMKSFQPKEPLTDDDAAPAPGPAEPGSVLGATSEADPARDAGQTPEPAPPSDKTDKTEASPEKPGATATTAPSESQPAMPRPATDTSKSRNAEVDFHGQKRSNATHASTTDREARLYRKGPGKEAKLAYLGHALAENRHGLIVNAGLTQATGTAERDAALPLVAERSPGGKTVTLGADKGYDTAGFVADCRAHNVTPHVAQNNKNRASAIDARTTRHPGYAQSQKKRKLIEEAFGWAKTIGGLARPMRRGIERMAYAFTFSMAAYDLVRLPRLLATAA